MTDPTLPDERPTEESVLAYLHSRPAMAAPIRDALRWELRHPHPFAWWEAKVWQRVLDRLTVDGIIDRMEGARYRFRDPQAVLRALVRYDAERREARERLRSGAQDVPAPPGAPPDLFGDVVGYPDVKRQLLLALAAPEPIHVLLYGPPATAKSLFLEALATLPGAVYRFCDSVTRAGLRKYLLEDKPPVLLLDELEKFGPDEDTALLEFLERGRISMMKVGANRDDVAVVRVFAAANKIGAVRPELLSRFHRIALREYDRAEFTEVADRYLRRRGRAPEIAHLIAEGVAAKTRDIRDARRIASMSRSPEDVVFLLDQLGREAQV